MSRILPSLAPSVVTVPRDARIACYSETPYSVSTERFPTSSGPEVGRVLFSGSNAFTSDVFANGARIVIRSEGPLYYSVGTNAIIAELQAFKQPSPVAFDVTGNLPVAAIMARIVTSSTAAAVTATLPTGAALDAANSFENDDYIDWKVINTGSNTFTVQASTGHTIVGGVSAQGGNSNRYRTRKVSANTFVSYRI